MFLLSKKEYGGLAMYRLFHTHSIRKSLELPILWDMKTLDREIPFTQKIPIPCCVESIPQLSSYKGKCEFQAFSTFQGNCLLTFKGVSHTSEVFLDNNKLGEHYGAYGEFSFLLKNQSYHKHKIAVIADNSYSDDSSLHIENDYYSYCGITRPVILEQLNQAYIHWVHITPIFTDNSWKLTADLLLENITDRDLILSVQTSLSDSDHPLPDLANETDLIGSTANPTNQNTNDNQNHQDNHSYQVNNDSQNHQDNHSYQVNNAHQNIQDKHAAKNQLGNKHNLDNTNNPDNIIVTTNSAAMSRILSSTVSKPLLVPANSTLEYSITLDCPDVQSYSPDQPILYYLHSLLLEDGKPIDDMIERFGFREIRVCGTDILWNGNPITMKGVNRHEDYAEFGCCLPLNAMYRDIMLIKDTGANCIRTCHYPNDERFLDLCDENGLYVWEEAHARGLSEERMRNPHFQEQSSLSVQEMITYHYNHPSIFVWGLLNECASDTPYGRTCYEKLITQIRSLDNSRPVTFASCRFDHDLCLDLVDIVSYNFYPGWYHKTPCITFLTERKEVIDQNGGKEKPLIISEIGAGAIYGYRSNTHAKWTEDYQATILKEQIKAVFSLPGCSGIILWQYADCRVDESWFSNRPKSQNNKGIVDSYRREKLGYEVVKELFTGYQKE